MDTELYYHGSPACFDAFDLSHVLTGHGDIKFGYGVYLTSSERRASGYSSRKGKGKKGGEETAPVKDMYVYTCEVPAATPDNHLGFHDPIHPDIIVRLEAKLGRKLPEEWLVNGKELYNGMVKEKTLKKNGGLSKDEARKVISELLDSIGVIFMTWPINWKRYEDGMDRCYYSERYVKIVKREHITLEQ